MLRSSSYSAVAASLDVPGGVASGLGLPVRISLIVGAAAWPFGERHGPATDARSESVRLRSHATTGCAAFQSVSEGGTGADFTLSGGDEAKCQSRDRGGGREEQ